MADLGGFLSQTAKDTAQTLLNFGKQKPQDSKSDNKDGDGTPPDKSTPPPPVMVTPQGMPPSQIGSKPGLIDKVKDSIAHRISDATWNLVDEAKEPTNVAA